MAAEGGYLLVQLRPRTHPVSPPSVTKQFSQLVAPDLIALGFTPNGTKQFRRLVGDIIQVIFLHVESRIRREFMIEYCAFLISVPHTHYSLEHGGRFPVGSHGTWYRADTSEKLEQSMTQVRAAIPALVDWFRASETLPGFLGTFSTHCSAQPPALVHNGHTAMTLACGHVSAGDFHAARLHAMRALSEFESILASFRAQHPTADHWAPVCIERAQALIAAIDASATDSLLAEWRALTTGALKIHR